MTRKEDWLQGNRLIWVFMGRKEMEADISFYSSDWSMLIPVVEKIEDLKYKTEIIDKSCLIYSGKYNPLRTYSSSKIEAVWLAVIEFIEWYNQNKK